MTIRLLAKIPILPESPFKRNYSISSTSSAQTTTTEEYFTPRSSIRSHKTSSDSESTLTDHSSTEDTDYEDYVNISSSKHVRFNIPTFKPEIQLKLENDEAEFFAVIPSEDTINDIDYEKNNTNKSIGKRDKIRSAFKKKFHRFNSDTSDTDTNEWDEMLAKSLISIHQDIQEVIAGFDQIDGPLADDSQSNPSEPIITEPRLSFRERQREKIAMMRMAQMIHPPNLLTCDMKESPYPYTDIVEPHHFNLHHGTKQIPFENLFIQHKPFRHKKFRYRTQRGLIRIRHDLKKLKRDLYGKHSIKSHKELPSLNVQNYRNRLEQSLLDVRTQIAEYDRIHSSTNNHRQSISQIIAKMRTMDPTIKAQIEDYRTKLRPVEYIQKKPKTELISAPFIPRRARFRPDNKKSDKNNNHLIDTRFDPSTFIDLDEEVEDFFGSDLPFWNRPPESRLSFSLPSLGRQSNHFTLPSKIGVWDRVISSFRSKQKKLRAAEFKEIEYFNDNLLNQSHANDDDFFDCTSPSFQQRKSQSSITFNEQDTVDF